MAWLSVGTSNADLCEKLRDYNILNDERIMNAFQATDRGNFVFSHDRSQAYHDRPYRRDFVHISAPHMYVSVLEALDLKEGHSFLNIGSGSGYLCCLASFLVGDVGIVQGIEVNNDTVIFCRRCCDLWRQETNTRFQTRFAANSMEIVNGNAFDLNVASQALRGRFDRIYIGAACPEEYIRNFLVLLRDDGVLVAPIEEKNQLVRVRKICGDVFTEECLMAVHFAPLILPTRLPIPLAQQNPQFYDHHLITHNESITQSENEIFKKVESLPGRGLFISPSTVSSLPDNQIRLFDESLIVLPVMTWAPTKLIHSRYPVEFRKAVYTLMLCISSDNSYQSTCATHTATGDSYRRMRHAQSRIPRDVWLHVLSFMTRDWFVPQLSQTQQLKLEVLVERKLRGVAEEACRVSEAKARALERERDMLKLVLTRYQNCGDIGGSGGRPYSGVIPSSLANLFGFQYNASSTLTDVNDDIDIVEEDTGGDNEEEEDEEDDEEEDDEDEEEEEEDDDDEEEENEESEDISDEVDVDRDIEVESIGRRYQMSTVVNENTVSADEDDVTELEIAKTIYVEYAKEEVTIDGNNTVEESSELQDSKENAVFPLSTNGVEPFENVLFDNVSIAKFEPNEDGADVASRKDNSLLSYERQKRATCVSNSNCQLNLKNWSSIAGRSSVVCNSHEEEESQSTVSNHTSGASMMTSATDRLSETSLRECSSVRDASSTDLLEPKVTGPEWLLHRSRGTTMGDLTDDDFAT